MVRVKLHPNPYVLYCKDKKDMILIKAKIAYLSSSLRAVRKLKKKSKFEERCYYQSEVKRLSRKLRVLNIIYNLYRGMPFEKIERKLLDPKHIETSRLIAEILETYRAPIWEHRPDHALEKMPVCTTLEEVLLILLTEPDLARRKSLMDFANVKENRQRELQMATAMKNYRPKASNP